MNKKFLPHGLLIVALAFAASYGHNAYAAAPSISFTADNYNIVNGQPALLSWSSDADKCTGGGFSTDTAPSGSVYVYPAANTVTTYGIACVLEGVRGTAQFNITASANPPITVNVSASPGFVATGSAVTVSWSSTNATACTINGNAVGTGGSLVYNPTVTTKYTVVCTGGSSTGTNKTTVGVYPTVSLSANPTTIYVGGSSLLSWSSVGATDCTLESYTPGYSTTSMPTAGSRSVSPPLGSATYSMYCINKGDGFEAPGGEPPVYVNVIMPPLTASCNVSPTSASVNQTVHWFASASGGTAPYSFNWTGDNLTGGTGADQFISYLTSGIKSASVIAKDTASGSGSDARPIAQSDTQYQVCTGGLINQDTPDYEDGGVYSDMINAAKLTAENISFNPPADFQTNSQAYCVQWSVGEKCNPSGTTFGTGSCPFKLQTKIFSGTGTRAQTGLDTIPGYNYGATFGTVAYVSAAGGTNQQTVNQSCINNVNVAATLPQVTLSANPVSISAGGTSQLTWSSINADSCTATAGPGFVTGGVTNGVMTVTPPATSGYTVSCSGPGGAATASVTITVAPLPPDLTVPTIGPPVTMTQGGSHAFTGTVVNGPAAATGGPFENTMIIYQSDQINWLAWQNVPSAALAAGAVSPQAITMTLPPAITPGSYYYRLCADFGPTNWAGNITESDEGNNCSTFALLTVTAPLLPDLIVPTIGPPVSVVQGGSYAFTGTVKNQAPASTGAAFENTMIIYDVDKITWLAWKNAPETTLSANGSSPRSITVALPPAITPGSYYYRLCADYGPTTSWAGNITESDEGNNCSNFAPLTVTAPLLPGLTCTANPTNVNTGGTVNFIITPVNGAIGPYTWHDSDGTTGSTVSPFFSRTYLTAPGVYQMDVKAKNMATTQTCTNQVTVTGTYCAVGPSVATIDAVPTRVKAGGYSTISWSASNVQGNGGTCTISGPGLNRTVPAGPPPSCLVDPDQATLQINQRSIYTITCTGGGTDSVTVNLVPQFKEF